MNSENRKSNKILLTCVPALAIFALVAGILIGANLNTIRRSKYSSANDKFGEILSLISSEYVDSVNTDSLLEETIPLMLANLDPHTAYIPAKDLDDVNADLEGSFSGIGIQFQQMNDTIMVLEVIPGGPSEKAGLLPGDRIVEVNDSSFVGPEINTEHVRNKLRGPKDSKVKLGIKRPGAPGLMTYTITRGDVPVSSIDASYMIAPNVGFVKVNTFGRNTFTEFFTEMLRLKAEGATDFILDLRGNAGGFLDIAIRIANEFLNAGDPIVETRGRNDESMGMMLADGTGSFRSGKLAVLIDEFSASASEIVAGAIQDNDRGTVIGRRSFGKGLVQSQRDLSDGSAIRITTARYYTPSGRCIQKPFEKGDLQKYNLEIYDRYASGEAFSADSVKFDSSLLFHTLGGREVYGGGGIMPDIFVPADTANVTGYYTQAANSGMFHRFAFKYTDENRTKFDQASTSADILEILPPDDILLSEFVQFAAKNGIPARWYYINISRPILVNAIKAVIAREVLGRAAYYEVDNTIDNAVRRAVDEITRQSANDSNSTK